MSDMRLSPEEYQRLVRGVERACSAAEQSLSETRQIKKAINGRLDDHGKRIGALERWRSFLTGAAAIITLLAGAALSKLAGWI